MVQAFCDWLVATPLSVAFQSANWFVPLVQTVHIMAIAILLTSIYFISFRLIGVTRAGLPLSEVSAKLMPWIWGALSVLLLTGALLTITEPARELLNWVFRTKMVMVAVLAALVWSMQHPMHKNPLYWTVSRGRRYSARAIGIVCLAMGAGIVTAGRWIAYV